MRWCGAMVLVLAALGARSDAHFEQGRNSGKVILVLMPCGEYTLRLLPDVTWQHGAEDALHGYSSLPYPEDQNMFMQAWVPPLLVATVSQFLVEIFGLLNHVEYILHVECISYPSHGWGY